MSVINSQPPELSVLWAPQFQVEIERLPVTSFFIREVQIPGLSANPARQETPGIRPIFRQPDTAEFDNLTCEFLIDEDFTTYNEVYTWFRQAYTLFDQAELKTWTDADKAKLERVWCDATVTLLNTASRPNFRFKFNNIFPIQLGQVTVRSTDTETMAVTCSVTFQINGFETESV